MAAHTYNPSPGMEAESEQSQVWGQSRLYSKLSGLLCLPSKTLTQQTVRLYLPFLSIESCSF